MATSHATTSASGEARWRQRLSDLGLSPADAVGHRLLKHTGNLAEYKKWFDFPERAGAAVNDVKAERVATIPDALVRRYVTEHVMNERVIQNPDVVAAIEKRVGRFYLWVLAAPNRVVTAQDPLIVNNSGVITVYNDVTIKDGGYIRITVPCKFECQTLTKVQDGGSSPYDVYAVGADGTHDSSGNSPAEPKQAGKGDNAECDCCGGAVAHNATPGIKGHPGERGGDAPGEATSGDAGPQVYFIVHQALNGTVSFLNQGGAGGRGGNGGTGARGGKGGKGGDGTTCGAYQPDGARGGEGGKGGNGGNGSHGKDGGAGATLAVVVPPEATSNVLVTNGIAPAGARGTRGFKGLGGAGGEGGAHGGTQGADGKEGDSDGIDGEPGREGSKGTSTLNGSPVGN